jgi:hypothetical protein
MNCTNCGKPITGTPVTDDIYNFCNAICRYEWRKNGRPVAETTGKKKETVSPYVNAVDLDFYIEPPGFGNRNMKVHVSHWVRPRLFIDGQRVMPVKKKVFGIVSDFITVNNHGETVKMRLRKRPLDLIPFFYINGEKILLARPLSVLEYIWVCLPLLLLFGGGAIGGLLAGAATYSNSLLMRKKQVVLRYLMTGMTTLMAVTIFFGLIGQLKKLGLHLQSDQVVERRLAEIVRANNRDCPKMLANDMRYDSMGTGQERTLINYFSFPTRSVRDINADSVKQVVAPALIQGVRTNESLSILRESDVTIIFKFFDRDRNEIFAVTVTPADYK